MEKLLNISEAVKLAELSFLSGQQGHIGEKGHIFVI